MTTKVTVEVHVTQRDSQRIQSMKWTFSNDTAVKGGQSRRFAWENFDRGHEYRRNVDRGLLTHWRGQDSPRKMD